MERRRKQKVWLTAFASGLLGPFGTIFFSWRQRAWAYVGWNFIQGLLIFGIREVFPQPKTIGFFTEIIALLIYTRYGPNVILAAATWYIASDLKKQKIAA